MQYLGRDSAFNYIKIRWLQITHVQYVYSRSSGINQTAVD